MMYIYMTHLSAFHSESIVIEFEGLQPIATAAFKQVSKTLDPVLTDNFVSQVQLSQLCPGGHDPWTEESLQVKRV